MIPSSEISPSRLVAIFQRRNSWSRKRIVSLWVVLNKRWIIRFVTWRMFGFDTQGPKETVDYNTIPWQAQIPSKMCWCAVHNHSLWQNRGIGCFFHSARLYMGSSCNQLYCKYPLFGEGLDMLIDPSPSSAMSWKPLWRSPSCVNYSLSSSSGTSLVPREFPIRPMLLLHITISAQGRYQDRERRNASFNCASKLRNQKTGHVRLRLWWIGSSSNGLRICDRSR